MESRTANIILQQVDSDTTSPSLERSVLLEIISTGTQDSDHVIRILITMRIKDRL